MPHVVNIIDGFGHRGRPLPPLAITDAMILKATDLSSWFSDDPRSPAWIGWSLTRTSRRDAANTEHRREIETALAGAIKRGIVVTIARRGSRLRYYARPIVVAPHLEIVRDELVPPPRPKLAASKPKRRKIVAKRDLPRPPPPPPAPVVSLKVSTVHDLAAVPAALALYVHLRVAHGEAKSFDVDVIQIAAALGWNNIRVDVAMRELVRRELLITRNNVHYTGPMSGSYGFEMSGYKRKLLNKFDRSINRQAESHA